MKNITIGKIGNRTFRIKRGETVRYLQPPFDYENLNFRDGDAERIILSALWHEPYDNSQHFNELLILRCSYPSWVRWAYNISSTKLESEMDRAGLKIKHYKVWKAKWIFPSMKLFTINDTRDQRLLLNQGLEYHRRCEIISSDFATVNQAEKQLTIECQNFINVKALGEPKERSEEKDRDSLSTENLNKIAELRNMFLEDETPILSKSGAHIAHFPIYEFSIGVEFA